MLFIQPSSAKCFIGGHPGLALIGGKEPGLRLFVSKGGQIQSLQLSQGSQICRLLHDNDCKPGVYFPGGGSHNGLSCLWVGCGACLLLENLLLQCSVPSERRCQQWGTQASAHKGSNALVRASHTLTWPTWEQFGVSWCQQSWLRHWICAAAVPSHSLALNHLQLSCFCGLIFPSWEGTSTSKLCREKIHCKLL